MTSPASYIFSAYSFIFSLPKEQLLRVGNVAADGSPIPSFDENLLIKLCDDASKVFEKEENIIEINGDVIVVGDIHGSFHDLIRIISFIETSNPNSKVIFLGDYVDRGNFSLECITLLFSLKLLKPDTYYLLRGNHEFNEMCSCYGFKKEILYYHNPKKSEQIITEQTDPKASNIQNLSSKDKKKDHSHFLEETYFANHTNINCYKYTDKLYQAFMVSFSYLPICAIVNKTSLCLHGGLTSILDKVKSIQKQIQRPIDTFDQCPLLTDIVWGDPAPDQSQLFSDNPRGRGKLFNGPVVVNFLKNNNLTRLIRGHECVTKGIEKNFNGKCITVFSASSYSCDLGNSSGILKIYQKDDKTQSIIFEPILRLKKCDTRYYKVQSFDQSRQATLGGNKTMFEYKSRYLINCKKIGGSNSNDSLTTALDMDKVIQKDTSKPLSPGRRAALPIRKLPSLKSGPRKKTGRPLNCPYIFTPQMINQNEFISNAIAQSSE